MIPMHNQHRYMMICLCIYILGFPLMYLLFPGMTFLRAMMITIFVEFILWGILTGVFYIRTIVLFTRFSEALYKDCDIPKAKRVLEETRKHRQSEAFMAYTYILLANAHVLEMDHDKVKECLQAIKTEKLHGMMKLLYLHNTCVYMYRMNNYETAHEMFLAIELPKLKTGSMQTSFYRIKYEQLQSTDAYYQQKITRQAYMKCLYNGYLEAPTKGERVIMLYELYQLHALNEIHQQAIANYILQHGNTYASVKQIIESKGESYE